MYWCFHLCVGLSVRLGKEMLLAETVGRAIFCEWIDQDANPGALVAGVRQRWLSRRSHASHIDVVPHDHQA